MAQHRSDIAVLVDCLLTVIDPEELTIGELNGICRSFSKVECSNPEIVEQVNDYEKVRSEYQRAFVYKTMTDPSRVQGVFNFGAVVAR